MRVARHAAFVIASIGVLFAPPSRIHGQGPGRMQVWAPMPEKPNPYVPPHKPVTRISELLAKHKGEPSWTELVVNDNLFHGEYIAMAPGAKTPRRFHQDNRAFWIVQDGQIRFTIEGQQPFVASKGFLVQVPKRLIYSMETVGDRPSLRFEVTMANSHTMYPADETPAPEKGVKYIRTSVVSAKGAYDAANVPYIDYNQVIAGHPLTKKNPTQFVGDSHDGGYINVGIVNILRGNPLTQAPARDDDLGHFHLTGPEFWFILEGQMELKIPSMPALVADQGDIVYAPAQTWHRLRFAGKEMATRLAIVGYENSHVYQPSESGQ
jgi:mannose-6-phosphate isomerase-like protein (cupin superfamily)